MKRKTLNVAVWILFIALLIIPVGVGAGDLSESEKSDIYDEALGYFSDGDYAAAQQLLQQIDGYEQSNAYLTECRRLLTPIEIDDQAVKEKVLAALNAEGIHTESVLYIYQAEALKKQKAGRG